VHQPDVISSDEIGRVIDRPFHISRPVESRVGPSSIDDGPVPLVGEDVRIGRHRLDDLRRDGERAELPLESQHEVGDHTERRRHRADDPSLRHQDPGVRKRTGRGKLSERGSKRLGGVDSEDPSL